MLTIQAQPIKLSPEDIARVLVEGNSEGQAAVFNEMARLSSLWERPFCFQMTYIADGLTTEAREMIAELASYALPPETGT